MSSSAEIRIAVATSVGYAVDGMRETDRLKPIDFRLAAALKLHDIWATIYMKQYAGSDVHPDQPHTFVQALSERPSRPVALYAPMVRLNIALLRDGRPIPNPEADPNQPFRIFEQNLPYPVNAHLDWIQEEDRRIGQAISLGLHPTSRDKLRELKKQNFAHQTNLTEGSGTGQHFNSTGGPEHLSVISWFANHLSSIKGFESDPQRDMQTAAELLNPETAKWLILR